MAKKIRKLPDAGDHKGDFEATVDDVMTAGVITITRHQTVGHAHQLMLKHTISSLPVVDEDGAPVGVLTSTDLLDPPAPETLVGKAMTPDVYTIPRYSGLHLAARMMRKHKIHHLVVTNEKKVVGVVSSFDLLRLVEERRFRMKDSPSRPKKGSGKRRREEGSAQG